MTHLVENVDASGREIEVMVVGVVGWGAVDDGDAGRGWVSRSFRGRVPHPSLDLKTLHFKLCRLFFEDFLQRRLIHLIDHPQLLGN
jgi:hypothetical protein